MEQQLARGLVRVYGTCDPFRIASSRNIEVVFEDLGKNIMGYYTCLNRIPSIHINNRFNDFNLTFSCAHELGHHFLHHGVNTPFLKKNTLFSLDKIEREANQFAVHLLIGDSNPYPGETKSEFLLRSGIPVEFLEFYQ